jgi:hypothetical protein
MKSFCMILVRVRLGRHRITLWDESSQLAGVSGCYPYAHDVGITHASTHTEERESSTVVVWTEDCGVLRLATGDGTSMAPPAETHGRDHVRTPSHGLPRCPFFSAAASLIDAITAASSLLCALCSLPHPLQPNAVLPSRLVRLVSVPAASRRSPNCRACFCCCHRRVRFDCSFRCTISGGTSNACPVPSCMTRERAMMDGSATPRP